VSDELSSGSGGSSESSGSSGFTDATDELSVVLREFAAEAEQEARPALTGAQVRGRAVRRARRRMAGLLGAGAVALALVGFALTQDLTGKENGRRLPGATTHAAPSQSQSPPLSPPATSADISTPVSVLPATGSVDLAKRALLIGDRVMPLSSYFSNSPAFVGPLTVYRKHATKVETVVDSTDGVGSYTEISLAVELRDADDEPVYVGVARSYKGKSLRDTGGGWIGLDAADAKWFYEDAKIGSVLSVTGSKS